MKRLLTLLCLPTLAGILSSYLILVGILLMNGPGLVITTALMFLAAYCLATQILIGLPIHSIFSRCKAHPSLYLITGYALGLASIILFTHFIWEFPSGLPLAPLLFFGLPAIPQAWFTYYFGQKPNHQ